MPTSTVTNLGHCRSDSADGSYPSTQPDLVVETHAIDDAPVASIDQPSGEILAAGSPAAQRSIPDERLTRTITEVAASIAPALADAPPSLHSRLASWCDLHGLNDVSGDMRRRILARQAAYHHLLKATLYEYHHRHTELPELPADVRTGFQNARAVTGNPAFDECVLDDLIYLPSRADREPLIQKRTLLLDSTQPAEDVGRIYETVIPDAHRQLLGQFRTPPEIGTLMRTWTATGSSTVLDPGMGAGVLASAFHPDWDVSSDPTHVTGVDRSPLSILMGSTALTLYGQSHDPPNTDFLAMSPDDQPEAVDALVCNPPYTKGDALPPTYKAEINARFERETGLSISARSPLYAYFIYHSRKFLSAGDRAAFITPHSFLATHYGESLKQFLLERYSIEAFVQFNPESYPVFDNADTTALVTFLEAPAEDDTTGQTRFIRVDEPIRASTIRAAVRGEHHGTTDWGYVAAVQQNHLSPIQNWQARFTPIDIDTSGLIPLSDLATVHRGVSTGNVGFFTLSQDDVELYDLSEHHLTRLIRRPAVVDGYEFREADWRTLRAAGEAVWLLDPDKLSAVPDSLATFREHVEDAPRSLDDGRGGEADLVDYLRTAITDHDLSSTSTVEQGECWYRPPRRDSPRVLVPDSSRDGFPFVLNETDARNIHNYHGITNVSVDETDLKAVLAYLNSTVGQRVVHQRTRLRADGYESLGVRALKNLPVIDPRELDDETVVKLAGAFDDLRAAARRDDDTEAVRKNIDAVLQSSWFSDD